MKNYEWILFDADDTLFHFDAYQGLQRVFSQYNVEFTPQDYQEYKPMNKSLWSEYQEGKITIQQLKQRRFSAWAAKVQTTPLEIESAFQTAMHDICMPIEGAVSLLNALKGKIKLGIITNGFTQMQRTRLKHTGLSDHFEVLVVSEEVGVAKPHRSIFEHTLSLMGNPQPDKVLMVGDNPDSDIIGGLNAGLDTCWFNVESKPVPKGIAPQYQVSSHRELATLLLGSYSDDN